VRTCTTLHEIYGIARSQLGPMTGNLFGPERVEQGAFWSHDSPLCIKHYYSARTKGQERQGRAVWLREVEFRANMMEHRAVIRSS
jgi:hypothetical protein